MIIYLAVDIFVALFGGGSTTVCESYSNKLVAREIEGYLIRCYAPDSIRICVLQPFDQKEKRSCR